MRTLPRRCLFVTVVIVTPLAFVISGCRQEVVVPNPPDRVTSTAADRELLDQAFSSLNRMSELGPREVKLQVVERLNQWSRGARDAIPWTPDPMLAPLSAKFGQWELVRQIDADKFIAADADFLFEAILLRDTARVVCKGAKSELEMARRLFDWTVDNIALDDHLTREKQIVAKLPWQTLVFGHGNYNDRAWLFMRLARQQNLEVVHVTVPLKTGIHEWCALVLGSEHEKRGAGPDLYLFDHICGLPIAGKEAGSVATLKQIAVDDGLLRRFDVEGQPYPVQSKHASRILVAIETNPGGLSKRMKRVEQHFSGARRVVLTSRPIETFNRLKQHPQIAKVGLWTWPYFAGTAMADPQTFSRKMVRAEMQPFEFCLISEKEHIVQAAIENGELVSFQDPEKYRERLIYPLWSGRLKHLTGQLHQRSEQQTVGNRTVTDRDTAPPDVTNAKWLYQKARTFDFRRFYNTTHWGAEQLEYAQIYMKVSQGTATHWLGVIGANEPLAEGRFDGAQFYLRSIINSEPPSRWRAAAQFQLARIHERLGEKKQAIDLYRAIPGAAGRGCKIRAQRLAIELGAESAAAAKDGNSPRPSGESEDDE